LAFVIRQLQAGDAADYRELRLEALTKCPEAFSSSVAEDEGLPLSRYESAISTNFIIGGFSNTNLEGVIALSRPNYVKVQHRAVITGIYVREAARGTGLADDLVKAAKKLATDGVEVLQFRIPKTIERAVALCRRSGFEEVGIEPHALRLEDGRYIDQVVMTCSLGR
jgi:ribosomal protein S18 acetylase RimI-like enzyme